MGVLIGHRKDFGFYSTLVGKPLECSEYRSDKIRFRFQQYHYSSVLRTDFVGRLGVEGRITKMMVGLEVV